ncbi:hypothetical protein [Burkholderia contaminans]|uniref:hypothetical protein n=1 Tax=Burkholderia contaminans TaxID=488447 RepID=UPI001CF1A92C|nr:hypothetical protein [Burkholderia contaminans]MCA8100141.1 hypothetical protein [Burkholderia contaminans]
MDASLPHREAQAFDMSERTAQDQMNLRSEAEAIRCAHASIAADTRKTSRRTFDDGVAAGLSASSISVRG